MNKLYTIRFRLSNGYVISVWNCWTPEWKFTVTEDNDTHKIWDAH